jgi:hypothetical protein
MDTKERPNNYSTTHHCESTIKIETQREKYDFEFVVHNHYYK